MNKIILYIISVTFFFLFHQAVAQNQLPPKESSFSLEEATISTIHSALNNHQITCEQLINLYIERIKQYNLSVVKKSPINAFTEIIPNVIEQARQLDSKYLQTHKLSGALHCIPTVLKDNIDTYDMTSTAGSLPLLGNQPNKDAFLVLQLRKAGAIILGKSGMDELAAGFFGISSRTGRIGNVYDTNKNPGGSSGGSAAAISSNFAVIGIGTDNSGSIRIPAAFNGIYGLRPSTGLISQSGIFPSGNLDGTAGPLTRTVADLARVMDVIARTNPDDTKTLNKPRVKTYVTYLNKDGLQRKRIGIVHQVGDRNTFQDMPDTISQLFKRSLKRIHQSGATVIR